MYNFCKQNLHHLKVRHELSSFFIIISFAVISSPFTNPMQSALYVRMRLLSQIYFSWCSSLWWGISCLFYWVSCMCGLLGNFPWSHMMEEPAQNYRFILRDGIWISSMAFNVYSQRRSGFSEFKKEFVKILIACERIFVWQIFKVGPEQYLSSPDTF